MRIPGFILNVRPYNGLMQPPAIETTALVRTYSRPKKRWAKPDPTKPAVFTALAGVDLQVNQGELFGLLGPNGAGKTTLIKILTTLLAPTSGTARVLGYDVVAQSHAVKPRINMVSGGETSGYGILTVKENLWLFARIYGVANDLIQERVNRMLRVVDLQDKADSRISHLSTGQRQKMNFCRGFITDPDVLFLDEPTLGLDVTAARAVRAFIREWLAEKPTRTVLLTTHYMAEADELCDRLAIIEKGQVKACDTPNTLKRRVAGIPAIYADVGPRGGAGGGGARGAGGSFGDGRGIHRCHHVTGQPGWGRRHRRGGFRCGGGRGSGGVHEQRRTDPGRRIYRTGRPRIEPIPRPAPVRNQILPRLRLRRL